MKIRIAHSPDSDDAFMFYGLASGQARSTPGSDLRHELQDIETLNRRALKGELEVTAVSIHAYAFLLDKYALLPSGCSMGDRCGPGWCIGNGPIKTVTSMKVAIPGRDDDGLPHAAAVRAAFRLRRDAVRSDSGQGGNRAKFDAGYSSTKGSSRSRTRAAPDRRSRRLVAGEDRVAVAAGRQRRAARSGPETIRNVSRLIKESIRYSLDHRQDALTYAANTRDMDRELADRFVGMYVNDWTLDYGERGRAAVVRLLEDARTAGLLPGAVKVEFAA